jgi:hypothetical protein
MKTPSTKIQKPSITPVMFEAWCFSAVWILDLGVSTGGAR